VPFLERLVLHRAETRAWALYDFANSAMFTVVITAIFPIYFRQVAAEGMDDDLKRRLFAGATTASLAFVALLGPILGAISDTARIKKKLFGAFLGLGVLANAGMFFIGPGDGVLACVLFALVNLGAAGSFVFYDALIVSVAAPSERDRLSTAAYAIGYLGGGVCLAICLALIEKPEWFGLGTALGASLAEKSLPARVGFLFVALWWAGFSIPFFLRVKEVEIVRAAGAHERSRPIRSAIARLRSTGRELRSLRHAFVFLLAFFAYNEGIGTVIRMATTIGDERGIETGVLIQCVLLVQFVGVPASLAFGKLAGRFGAKRAILAAVVVYVGIAVLAYRLTTPGEFLVLAILVGLVQGGAQALSRSLFASLIPPHKAGEFFGFFATLEKFAGLAGPAVFAFAPSSGFAIVVLIGFFALGAVLLAFVDVDAGHAAALRMEQRALDSR